MSQTITINGWNKDMVISPEMQEIIKGIILNDLNSQYKIPTGEIVWGQSSSFLQQTLRQRGIKGISGLSQDFEKLVAALGFCVINGARSVDRNQRAIIITEKKNEQNEL